MTLIQIYCIGFLTQALYMAIQWMRKSKAKKTELFSALDNLDEDGMPSARKMMPFILVLMCLVWPYVWIEKILLKRKSK